MKTLTASIVFLSLALPAFGQCKVTGETSASLSAKVQKVRPLWSLERVEAEANTAAEACYRGDHKTEARLISVLLRQTARCSATTKAGAQCRRNSKAGQVTCWQHKPIVKKV